MGRTHNWI